MNNNRTMIDITELAAETARLKQEFERQQNGAMQAARDALTIYDRARAQQEFHFALKCNQLYETASSWFRDLTDRIPPTYVCDSWFLRTSIQKLTPGPDEEIAHVTGPQFGVVRVLSRLCPLRTEQKSPVYAKGTAQSCADTEIEILEHGNRLLAMAHCHPGAGPGATCPSGIDVNYLGRIQRAGAETIGIIVTRDGCVRFFTVHKPFRAIVTGSGVTQLEEHVYKITLHKTDR
jgi:hypothetical protein